MACKSEIKVENFLEYFGTSKDVVKKIESCNKCGAKLLLSHLPDYKTLQVQENSRCLDCGGVNKRTLHVMN